MKPVTGLKGPYTLTAASLRQAVGKTAPGAFVLGYSRGRQFVIQAVGRSDSDLAKGLAAHVGRYREFKFDYAATPQAAFDRECRLFHDFKPPDNKAHPAPTQGTEWTCPACDAD